MAEDTKADILIAEDDPVLREVYVKKFTIKGYGIRTAEDGKEALEAIKGQPPDLLILDINMPSVDGFGVLEALPPNERQFPVILLTNYGDQNTRSRAEELGADDFFIKSEMTMRKLLEMVETLLKGKKFWGS